MPRPRTLRKEILASFGSTSEPGGGERAYLHKQTLRCGPPKTFLSLQLYNPKPKNPTWFLLLLLDPISRDGPLGHAAQLQTPAARALWPAFVSHYFIRLYVTTYVILQYALCMFISHYVLYMSCYTVICYIISYHIL